MGDRGHCSALPAGPDLGFWSDVCQREHGGHGLPVHHLQLPAGNVHLHLPLRPTEEGTILNVMPVGAMCSRNIPERAGLIVGVGHLHTGA